MTNKLRRKAVQRPAETGTIAAAVAAILVTLGMGSELAGVVALAVVALVPAVISWYVDRRRAKK